MKAYADTSFIVSLYVATDANHAKAKGVMDTFNQAPELPCTPFGMLELQNTFARMQKAGVGKSILKAYGNLVSADLKNGVLAPRPLYAYHWLQESLKLAKTVTIVTGTRTLDIMHVALARMNGAEVMLSFDKNQRAAAKAAGFALLPAAF
jgi:predicted nucleic acid-binding protein